MLPTVALLQFPKIHLGNGSLVRSLQLYVAVLSLLVVGPPKRVQAQAGNRSEMLPGSVIGTVSNVNGDTIANATVVLESSDRKDRRIALTNNNGFFEFHDVKPGIPFHITASAE